VLLRTLPLCVAFIMGFAACGRIGFDKQLLADEDAAPGGDADVADADNTSEIIIASGWFHTCAAIDGRVACWGEGGEGQLGQGDNASSAVPLPVNLPGPARALAAGKQHSCALVEGDVYCWGSNSNGRLGTGDTVDSLVPKRVVTLATGSVTSIAAANFSTCAVSQGTAYCWGLNSNGQLGIDTNQNASVVPVPVSNLSSSVDRVFAAADRACALVGTTGYCWGHDHSGDLGTAGNGGWMVEEVIVASGLSHLSLALSVGCGVSGGAVQCWGNGGAGQLGDGLFSSSTSAVDVLGMQSGVSDLHVAGGIEPLGAEVDTICAVRDGQAFCWGRNDYGQVGDQSMVTQGAPVPVVGLRGQVRSVNGGATHFCAVTAPNNIECWGRGEEGQLGSGDFADSSTPVLVAPW
jgi:alpha-tubulin suppressor-like RCC1 family protein